jgi:hypothetical protein
MKIRIYTDEWYPWFDMDEKPDNRGNYKLTEVTAAQLKKLRHLKKKVDEYQNLLSELYK